MDFSIFVGFYRRPRWSRTCLPMKDTQETLHPWIGKIPWRRAWQPTPALLPGGSYGWRSLTGYGPQGCRVRHNRRDLVCTQHFTTIGHDLIQHCYHPKKTPQAFLQSLAIYTSSLKEALIYFVFSGHSAFMKSYHMCFTVSGFKIRVR